MKFSSLSGNIARVITAELSEIPEVEFVLYRAEGPISVVASVINGRDYNVMHKIYDQQRKVIGRLARENFNFHIFVRDDREPSAFLPTDFEVLYRR